MKKTSAMVVIGDGAATQASRRRQFKFATLIAAFAAVFFLASVHWISLAVVLVSNSDASGGNGNIGAKTAGVVRGTRRSDAAPLFIQHIPGLEIHDVTPLMLKLTLKNEGPFLKASNKRCLPGIDDSQGEINKTTKKNRECLRHLPKEDIQRIGILAPPGLISDAFALWVEGGVRAAYNALDGGNGGGGGGTTALKTAKVDLIRSHRVPVYGYGKSHGWTKIIRLVTLPIGVGAYDEPEFSSVAEKHHGGSDNDATLLVRQIVRWQCRLSHVAAHTALITLSSTEALEDPVGTLDRVVTFVMQDPKSKGIDKYGSTTVVQDEYGNDVDPSEDAVRYLAEMKRWRGAVDQYATAEEEREGSFASVAQVTAAQLGRTSSWDDTKKIMEEALAAEMKRSKDMNVWPCPSFWEGLPPAGTEGGVSRKWASMVVPDCDDEFVKCTVKRDKCEMKGDPLCK